MKRPANLSRGGEPCGINQGELFDPPPFSPTYPNQSTLAWEALAMLLNGRAITHPDFESETCSWRLSEPIRALRHDFGWPVVTIDIPAPTEDRPDRHIAKYVLPHWVIETVGGARHAA